MFRNMILKKKKCLWHLRDGDNDQFLFYLVSLFILTTTVTLYIEFHLRHSKDGAGS